MRLLCFFGSGISRPSGMPMTDAITAAIFSGQWHKHTDDLFYPGPGGLKWDGVDIAVLAQGFLDILGKSAAGYLSSRQAGAANYEHLFSLAKIVEGELSCESLNPAFGDFVASTARETETLWKGLASPTWSGTTNDQLASLAREAQVLIESVVRNQIGPEKKPRGYQALLALLNDTDNFDHIDLGCLVSSFAGTNQPGALLRLWLARCRNERSVIRVLYSDRRHRLVLLHDARRIEPDILTSPSPWLLRYHALQASDQLMVIPKWLCCCSGAAEILMALN